VTSDRGGPRTLLLFAMKREAAPLVARLQPAWLEQYRTFAFLKSLPDPADFIEPTAEDVIFDFTGVGRSAARGTCERLLASFPSLQFVIAAGYCGALRSEHPVGTVAVPTEVIDEQGRTWPCVEWRPPWEGEAPAKPRCGEDEPRPSSVQLGSAGASPSQRGKASRLLTASRVIGDPGEKRKLGDRLQADFVDMESAAIAELCAERSIPFAAVRAVTDSCDTALSPELVRLLSGGNVSVWRALKSLVWKPALFREFLRLRRDTNLASRKLAEALAPMLG